MSPVLVVLVKNTSNVTVSWTRAIVCQSGTAGLESSQAWQDESVTGKKLWQWEMVI